LVAKVLGLVVGLGLVTACTAWPWSAPSSRVDRTVRLSFPAYGLSFDAPVVWRQARYDESSSFSSLIVYLSTEPLHRPCHPIPAMRGGLISCGWPLEQLRPGGVLVAWTGFGRPGIRLLSQLGTPTTISGHAARVVTGPADEICARVGGQIWVRAAISQQATGSHDQLLQMSACLRGPGVEAAEVAVHRMLDSVRITG
jgi:hypothetical protein